MPTRLPTCATHSTFNEEAERHCKAASDFLCDKMTVSGQGLVYNFMAETAEETEEKPTYPKKPTYGADKYAAEKYSVDADSTAAAAANKAPEEEETATDGETMDVFLSLINGVINTKKHMKWDNGALQVRGVGEGNMTEKEGRGQKGGKGTKMREGNRVAKEGCGSLFHGPKKRGAHTQGAS